MTPKEEKRQAKRHLEELNSQRRYLRMLGGPEYEQSGAAIKRQIVLIYRLQHPNDRLLFLCIHCERVSVTPEPIEVMPWCTYPDCPTQSLKTLIKLQGVISGKYWDTLRQKYHPEYPEMPEPGVRYPAPKVDRQLKPSNCHAIAMAPPAQVSVKVEEVHVRRQTGKPDVNFVLFQDQRQRRMPIFIDPERAEAISRILQDPEQSFHALDEKLVRMGYPEAVVKEMRIYGLCEERYFSCLKIRTPEREMQVRWRPSAALLVALPAKCPIFIKEEIFDTVSRWYVPWLQDHL